MPTLLVKVFEINTEQLLPHAPAGGGHRHQPRRPGRQRRAACRSTTTRRSAGMARRFEFPELTKPGVYVIDFIGGGKSSRALVRKGRLRPLVATGTAGQNDPRRGRDEPAGERRDGVARRAPSTPPDKDGVDHRAVHRRAGPPAGRPQPRRLRLPRLHRPPARGLPPHGRHPRRPREPADAAGRAGRRSARACS